MCIDNAGYEGSLYVGKVYQIIKPDRNDRAYDIRVIDEEGEDYLYSVERFVPVELPPKARKIITATKAASQRG